MPTLKQEKAIRIVLDNNGMSVGEAMRQAGYPATTASNPQQLTRSKAWEELMEEHLPDKLLAEKHRELLMADKKITQYKKGEVIEQTIEVDMPAIKAGLDMAYKLKGHYKGDKVLHSIDPELKAVIDQLNNILDE